VLHDRVYCARCIARKPNGLADNNYGRMRARYHKQRGYAFYLCSAYDRGYDRCGESVVAVHEIDEQLVGMYSLSSEHTGRI
jgi:hypothetical protein